MADAIKQALVLAAGMGERLRPLTERIPKPLLPLWGEPLIAQTIRTLEAAGVRRIAVNLHWRAEALRDYLSAWPGPAILTFSYEAEILGTGGALRPLRDWLGNDPFWLVNGDIVWHVDLAPLVDALPTRDRIAAAWLMPRRGPQTVAYDRKGDITTYRSPAPTRAGTATFCGVQLISPEIVNFFPDKPCFSIITAYERAQAAGRPVAGVRVPNSYWCDAGTLAGYLQAHADVKRLARRGHPAGAAYVPALDAFSAAETAFCCDLENKKRRATGSLLLPGTTINDGVRVRRCVVDGATVSREISDAVVVSAAACDDPVVPQALAALAWKDAAAIFLGKRGSARRFWRLVPNNKDAPSAIVVAYSRERSENARYAGHATLLAEAGVPVPNILADLPDTDTVVIEDWGDDSLLQRMGRAGADPHKLYLPVLKAAAVLHTRVTALALQRGTAMEPAFDETVYGWEHALFEKFLICGRYGLSGVSQALRQEMDTVARTLATATLVVVHRDFQSSNVLLKGGRMALIDFQGMRLGPAAYDLASLLCDPYVALDPRTCSHLLHHYATLCGTGGNDCLRLFPWAAVQRLVQALGAYARLASLGFPFAQYIPTAARLLQRQARACGLKAMEAEAKRIIGFEQKDTVVSSANYRRTPSWPKTPAHPNLSK